MFSSLLTLLAQVPTVPNSPDPGWDRFAINAGGLVVLLIGLYGLYKLVMTLITAFKPSLIAGGKEKSAGEYFSSIGRTLTGLAATQEKIADNLARAAEHQEQLEGALRTLMPLVELLRIDDQSGVQLWRRPTAELARDVGRLRQQMAEHEAAQKRHEEQMAVLVLGLKPLSRLPRSMRALAAALNVKPSGVWDRVDMDAMEAIGLPGDDES